MTPEEFAKYNRDVDFSSGLPAGWAWSHSGISWLAKDVQPTPRRM